MEDYVLVVDLEVDLKGDRKDPSPYNKYNELVAIGYLKRNLDGSKIGGLTVQIKNKSSNNFDLDDFEEEIKGAKYIVAHNAKFDVAWLREVGIECDVKIIDTMINEYVLSKGLRNKLSLDGLAEKYKVTRKESSLGDTLNKGLNYSDMSLFDQETYLTNDVLATAEVFQKQQERFSKASNHSLVAIRDLMCEFCDVLTDIERA